MPDIRRVTLVTDRLCSGGAERHLVNLAMGLKRRGCDVLVLVYWPDDFFERVLREAGISVKLIVARNRLYLIFAMRQAIRQSRPDVVIAFKGLANALAELAGLPRRDFALITSELSLDVFGRSPKQLVRHNLHRLADMVVSNSHAQRKRIAELAPYLNERTNIIINGVDLERFSLRPDDGQTQKRPDDRLRVLALARVDENKNLHGLLEAVRIVHKKRPTIDLIVDWYGDSVSSASKRVSKWELPYQQGLVEYHSRLKRLIAERRLQDSFRLHPAVKDVVPLYHTADVVCLPSFYEGTANVICEAMACGVPLLVSRVSDNPRLVRDGRNGFLFDPKSPEDIASAIMRFADTPPETRRRMGLEGRRVAETMLQESAFVERYIDLMERALLQRHRRGNSH